MKKIILLVFALCFIQLSFADSAVAVVDSPATTGDKIEAVITDITTIAPIKIDTVNSVDEIVADGLYLVKTAPEKGSAWTSYVLYA